MIAAAVRASRGWEPLELGDDVEVNFRQQAEEARRVLAEPSFQALMPALLEMGLTGQADDLVRSTVFPRRREMAEMYTICAAACGYRTDIAPELPNDLLVGAMIYHLLYDGAPPSSDEVQAMVGVVLDRDPPPRRLDLDPRRAIRPQAPDRATPPRRPAPVGRPVPGGRRVRGARRPRAGLDPSVQREAFDVPVEEVVPLLRG